MSTLQQLRQHLGRTWESIADGWHHLSERAGQALTRFGPFRGKSDVDSWEDQFVRRSADWGLLATEVQEDEQQIVVRIEVPGMEAEDFDIDVIDNYLVVRGDKHTRKEHRSGRYHVMECAYGSFERAVPLPMQVEADKAHAAYRRGVLSVSLPKHASARSRRIPINS